MSGIGYFDRVAVIHLPERVDRYRSIERELAMAGLSIGGPKVQFPFAPRPTNLDGFASRGVYGNFLSHLEIIKAALADGIEHVLILEDDAVFHRRLFSTDIGAVLERAEWDMCYFGYTGEIMQTAGVPRGFVRYENHYGSFYQAHCYAVHRRCLPVLAGYLQETLVNPAGHPRGGKMYIDGAFALFRKWYPEKVTLIASPSLCRQKGCPSSLAHRRWYDSVSVIRNAAQGIRAVRDEFWRRAPIA